MSQAEISGRNTIALIKGEDWKASAAEVRRRVDKILSNPVQPLICEGCDVELHLGYAYQTQDADGKPREHVFDHLGADGYCPVLLKQHASQRSHQQHYAEHAAQHESETPTQQVVVSQGPKKDINTATESDITSLRGFGKKLADKIFVEREKCADKRFNSMRSVTSISGLGPAKIGLLLEHFEVRATSMGQAAIAPPS